MKNLRQVKVNSKVKSKSNQNPSISSSPNRIAVEGPIGVGKSSLTRRLAHDLEVPMLLERADENPFLEQFYTSTGSYAFQTQLFFLMQRKKQLETFASAREINAGFVTDFMIDKDPLFAKLTLDEAEHYLYTSVFNSLRVHKLHFDLVIYLQAPVDVLQQRIRRRNVEYEQGTEASYLRDLSDAYASFFMNYNETPLLIVNAADINPVDNDHHYQELLKHIQQTSAGRHFFNPLV